MPEENLRMAVVGAPRADKEFDLFVADRSKASREDEDLAQQAERLEREVQRLLRSAEQTARGAARGRGAA